MCITESHCCPIELEVTLKISHTSTQFLEKNKSVPWFSSLPVSFLLIPAPFFFLQRRQIPLLCPHNPYFIKNYISYWSIAD